MGDTVKVPSEMLDKNIEAPADPKFLEALKTRIHNVNQCAVEIPKHLRRKVKALKKLQLDHVNLEVKFFMELHELEQKYDKLYAPLYEKRQEFVSGSIEPTDADCDFILDDDDEDEAEQGEILDGVKKIKMDDSEVKEKDIDVKGIPDFWLTALKSAPIIAELIEDADEPIMQHLSDVKARTLDEPMGFCLEFYFSPNPFFSNPMLSKYYEMKCAADPNDPFAFDGPEIIKCNGCVIDWKKGMNVTVKTVKKKQKHKARGAVRVVSKTVRNDSFFNFFSPPEGQDDESNMDEETRNILTADFEIGNVIKDRVIPQAVLFYTGENLIDEDYEDEDEEDEELDEEDEESEEDENDGHLVKKGQQLTQGGQIQPPECKTQ